MDNKFQNKYRIPSARATFHDYNGGAYFVTICTKHRAHFFGEIVHTPVETWHAASQTQTTSQMQTPTIETRHCHVSTIPTEPTMQLSEIGQKTDMFLQNMTTHNPYCEIPLYVVMPNHIHAIAFIDSEKTPLSRNKIETKNERMQEIANQQGWLSVAIGGFKSAVTKFARENGMEFAWQTRFHDRIIRDQKEMNLIAEYIEHNVARWNMDCYNKPETL